jgi:hypothetical protein
MAQENLKPDLGAAPGPPHPLELQPVDETASSRRKAATSPFLTRGNLALVAMFAAGIAGLYVLKLRSGPSAALADQDLAHAKVEAALNLLGGPPSAGELQSRSSAKAIVGEFYTAARQRQIDAKDLRGDPFALKLAAPKQIEPATQPQKAQPKPSDEADQAMQAAKSLKLQSVLVGKQTMAMISSNLVTTGQTIKGWTVGRISPREVELIWKDKTYLLEMPK